MAEPIAAGAASTLALFLLETHRDAKASASRKAGVTENGS